MFLFQNNFSQNGEKSPKKKHVVYVHVLGEP
jgi:hypothetical protein